VGDVTCLVGKNESGKTALLQALYRLNPIRDADAAYNVIDDYPRMEVTDYEDAVKRGERSPATVVRADFELNDGELAAVGEKFGPTFLRSRSASLSKDYGNSKAYTLDADENAAIKFLTRSLPDELLTRAKEVNTAAELLNGQQPSSSDPAVAAIVPLLEQVGTHPFGWYAWNQILKDHVPQFLYFDEYYQMRGCENIDTLQQRVAAKTLTPSDQPLLGLVELARLNLDELVNPQRTQDLKNKLEGAGNHLTRRILDYWSQNKHLQMRFDVRSARPGDPEGMRDGTNIWGEVYDTRHYVSTGLGSRSRGFVWFFSFVAWYSQIQRRRDNVILLLDEPGLALHGRGQGDLLRYFERELKPHHQLIYTTHSPFMVDPTHFDRVRIVQDKSIDTENLPKKEQGTKVFTDIFEASEDSLFPLQGALGYDIHQTLFIGPNSLLIEGPSDMFYIQAMSALLDSNGKVNLSPKWVLTPVGGAAKVPTFVRLLTGQRGMKVATLIDIQERDRQTIENIYRDKLLKNSNVLTYADFTGTKETDVEDMFEVEFYVGLVNAEYKGVLQKRLMVADLASRSPRIIVRLSEYFKHTPLKKGTFSHYRPARYFHENMATLAGQISAATIQRFQTAFVAVHKLL